MKAKKVLFKSKVALVYLIAALFGLGTTALAASTPVPAGGTEVESDTAIANVTAGHTQYYSSVNASINDVVKVQVWYHNKEGSTSGKTGNNFNVKVNIPTTDQTTNTITSVVGGTNTNIITNNTSVVTSLATTLQYIPGTAFRKYNAGTNENVNIVTVGIPDGVVTGNGYNIPALNPCWNFEETITVQARVMAPVVSIVKKVRIQDTSSYVTNLAAQSGSKLDYAFEIKNEGNVTLHNVIVRDMLPAGISFVPGSVSIRSALYPNGKSISDGIFTNGSNIGDFTPGSNAVISFRATVANNLSEGGHTFTNYAYVRSDELTERYNVAIVTVNIPTTPPVTPPITPPVTPPTNPLPTSGPAEAAAGAAGLTAAGGAGYAWLRSKKALLSALKKIK